MNVLDQLENMEIAEMQEYLLQFKKKELVEIGKQLEQPTSMYQNKLEIIHMIVSPYRFQYVLKMKEKFYGSK